MPEGRDAARPRHRLVTAAPPSPADALLSGLSGQRVIVTAGAAGIGLVTATTLSRFGCRIALCDLDPDALAAAAETLPDAFVHAADVADEAAMARFFDGATDALGGLDALINNAGIAGPTGAVEDISPEDWRRCIEVGLTGQFLATRLAVPLLKAQGGGAIVNLSSAAGRHGYPYRSPYSAAKFGVIGFTQSLAKELGPSDIRVNAVLPGIVEGPRIDRVIRDRAAQLGVSHAEMEAMLLEKTSLRRMVGPDDVANAIAFLLSDAGRNLSGMSFNIDGNLETL